MRTDSSLCLEGGKCTAFTRTDGLLLAITRCTSNVFTMDMTAHETESISAYLTPSEATDGSSDVQTWCPPHYQLTGQRCTGIWCGHQNPIAIGQLQLGKEPPHHLHRDAVIVALVSDGDLTRNLG